MKTPWKDLHRQQLRLARREPLGLGEGLALWAVPVAARVIGDGPVAALVTLLHVAAQGGGAAALDGFHHAPLAPGHRRLVRGAVRRPVPAEEVGDLERRASHHAPSAGAGLGSESNGLGVAPIVRAETWV